MPAPPTGRALLLGEEGTEQCAAAPTGPSHSHERTPWWNTGHSYERTPRKMISCVQQEVHLSQKYPPRELAGAVGEGATPCTDGRPSENTPAWLGLHQSSLPNAAKGYPRREPREPPREPQMLSCEQGLQGSHLNLSQTSAQRHIGRIFFS